MGRIIIFMGRIIIFMGRIIIFIRRIIIFMGRIIIFIHKRTVTGRLLDLVSIEILLAFAAALATRGPSSSCILSKTCQRLIDQ